VPYQIFKTTFLQRKVLEDGVPTVQFVQSSLGSGSPLHTIRSTLDPAFIGGVGTGATSPSFAPYNYKFGSSTSGTYHVTDDRRARIELIA
jgi:hypothetical protein